jgi:hypothetical protein
MKKKAIMTKKQMLIQNENNDPVDFFVYLYTYTYFFMSISYLPFYGGLVCDANVLGILIRGVYMIQVHKVFD